MTGLKDIINLLIPIPPIILVRMNELPNCPVIFEDIAKDPPNPRQLGRTFSRLCSMLGFSWIVWGFNMLVFTTAIIVFLYNWGNNIEMSKPYYFEEFSCQMLLAILAALLIFGKFIFYGVSTISLQLSERCYEYFNTKLPKATKPGKKK